MNLSSTLRPIRWAIAIALGGVALVVHAGPCQEEHGRETQQINADHKQEVKSCYGPGSAPCIKKANVKKAAGTKAANKKQMECNKQQTAGPEFKPLEPKLDPNDPSLKWKETFGLDPEKTVTLPDGTEEKIKNLALIERSGKILGFPPSYHDSSGHEWQLDRRTVKWDYIRGNDRMILPTGKYRDSQSGMAEWKPGLWLNRNLE